MSKIITRINGARFEVDGPQADGYLHFGDYRSAPDELARVMVYGQLDAALSPRASVNTLIEFGSDHVSLADVEYVARGTVNGKRVKAVLTLPCLLCHKTSTVYMPRNAYNKWHFDRLPIQQAWPEAHYTIRELLLSGTHAKCWDKLTGDVD